MFGLVVAPIIWVFISRELIVLMLLMIIIECVIVIIEIFFAYRIKVVKMRPKSSYDLGDISVYLKVQEQYRNGVYEYGTIKTRADIIKVHKKGKKIVFTAKKSKSFFVVDQQGIVYSKKLVGLRAYSWKELDLKIYRVKTVMRTAFSKIEFPFDSMVIHVILPNAAILKFDPEKYDLREFLSIEKIGENLDAILKLGREYNNALTLESREYLFYLISMTFRFYFEFGKLKLDDDSYDVSVKNYNEVISKLFIDRETSLEQGSHERMICEHQIFLYLKKHQGKAFTAQSLFNRFDELGLDEQVKENINLDGLVKILANTVYKGKIICEDKDGKTYYHY